MSRVRVKAYRGGLFAETLTAFLLRLRPHCIVAQRYKTPVGEIDDLPALVDEAHRVLVKAAHEPPWRAQAYGRQHRPCPRCGRPCPRHSLGHRTLHDVGSPRRDRPRQLTVAF